MDQITKKKKKRVAHLGGSSVHVAHLHIFYHLLFQIGLEIA